MLSAQAIGEGAYYAMQQAGHLINDAASLYERRRWASSLVLAVFCLEELGKAETLLLRAIDAARSGPKSLQEVMAGGNSHLTKLKSGRGGATVTASIGFWGEIPEPNTTEMAEIERQLAAAQATALGNAPRQAHEARMRALYVDLRSDGLWTRPAETSMHEAYLLVSAASIEYAIRRRKFSDPTEATMRHALDDVGRACGPLPEPPVIAWPAG